MRLQLHALAYNLANFLRTLALPAEVAQWSLSTLRDRLVKIGHHGRSVTFQMAEVMVLVLCSRKSWPPSRRCGRCRSPDVEDRRQTGPIWPAAGDVRPDASMRAQISADTAIVDHSAGRQQSTRRVTVAEGPVSGQSCLRDGQGGRSSGESRFRRAR